MARMLVFRTNALPVCVCLRWLSNTRETNNADMFETYAVQTQKGKSEHSCLLIHRSFTKKMSLVPPFAPSPLLELPELTQVYPPAPNCLIVATVGDWTCI